ncbi:polysialyltransferase family glycosyltransferase [Isachenkonia alkalipeptolytica]|uniref:Uncharacterized protein n=1 Tax=Isachenkonia alkalipeptolytica TaxID=2565777 RepID=A0AA44BEZ2_9CLOT|nr:polysialyltransferase family glycosyltransferase [Isachenkonia alkalipeptolytica]NBG89532.1 hypothetical protein [Isachenkonia alkalipeptolytica]
MNNIFVAHTPYHLILDSGIADAEYKEDNNYLIVFKDFEVNEIAWHSLRKCFNKVLLVESRYKEDKPGSIGKYFNNIIRDFKMIGEVKKIIGGCKVDNLFIHNDYHIVDKKIMQIANSKRNCNLIYIEDGSAAYNSGILARRKQLYTAKWKIKKALYSLGDYGYSVETMGSNSIFKECRVVFPEYARKELKEKNIKEISKEEIERGISIVYQASYNNDCINNAVVIFLDLFSFIEPKKKQYIYIIEEIFDMCKRLGLKIYIKYHPREKNRYLEFLKSKFNNIYEIKQGRPIETIYSNFGKKSIALSSVSTGLITLEKISKETKKISIKNMLDMEDEHISDIFSKINVLVPNTINELALILEESLNEG